MENYLHGVEVIEVNGFKDISNIFSATEIPTPVFTAFEIQGQAAELEIGDSITAGSKTFTWTIGNPSNLLSNSIRILDVTNSNAVLAQNLSNTGSTIISISAITNNTAASQIYRIEARDNNNALYIRDFVINWTYAIYSGETLIDPFTNIDSTIVGSLTKEVLGTVTNKVFSFPAQDGYQVWLIESNIVQPTSFTNLATNTNAPVLGTSTQHSIIVGGRNFRVYRTFNNLGGPVSIRINT